MDTIKSLLGQINSAFQEQAKQIRGYEKAFNSVRKLSGAPALKAADGRTRKKRKVSAKTIALRKQQGRYMGVVRNLKVKDKNKVKKILKEKGMSAAIKAAKAAASASTPAPVN